MSGVQEQQRTSTSLGRDCELRPSSNHCKTATDTDHLGTSMKKCHEDDTLSIASQSWVEYDTISQLMKSGSQASVALLYKGTKPISTLVGCNGNATDSNEVDHDTENAKNDERYKQLSRPTSSELHILNESTSTGAVVKLRSSVTSDGVIKENGSINPRVSEASSPKDSTPTPAVRSSDAAKSITDDQVKDGNMDNISSDGSRNVKSAFISQSRPAVRKTGSESNKSSPINSRRSREKSVNGGLSKRLSSSSLRKSREKLINEGLSKRLSSGSLGKKKGQDSFGDSRSDKSSYRGVEPRAPSTRALSTASSKIKVLNRSISAGSNQWPLQPGQKLSKRFREKSKPLRQSSMLQANISDVAELRKGSEYIAEANPSNAGISEEDGIDIVIPSPIDLQSSDQSSNPEVISDKLDEENRYSHTQDSRRSGELNIVSNKDVGVTDTVAKAVYNSEENHQDKNSMEENLYLGSEFNSPNHPKRKRERTNGESPVKLMSDDGSLIRSAVPYLPLPMAVICLILNTLLPGTGTLLGGFATLCCGKPRYESGDDRMIITICVNTFVGISQMMTVTFLLVGWFWSIAWGIDMIILAREMKVLKAKNQNKLVDEAFDNEPISDGSLAQV